MRLVGFDRPVAERRLDFFGVLLTRGVGEFLESGGRGFVGGGQRLGGLDFLGRFGFFGAAF